MNGRSRPAVPVAGASPSLTSGVAGSSTGVFQRRRVVEVDPVVALEVRVDRDALQALLVVLVDRDVGGEDVRPVRGSWMRTWPVRAVCSTRRSGSTARLIGSPGKSLRVTFWKLAGRRAAAARGRGARRRTRRSRRARRTRGSTAATSAVVLLHQVQSPLLRTGCSGGTRSRRPRVSQRVGGLRGRRCRRRRVRRCTPGPRPRRTVRRCGAKSIRPGARVGEAAVDVHVLDVELADPAAVAPGSRRPGRRRRATPSTGRPPGARGAGRSPR